MDNVYREVGIQEISKEDLSSFEEAKRFLDLDGPVLGGFISSSLVGNPRLLILQDRATWLLRVEKIPARIAAIAVPFFGRMARLYQDRMKAASQKGLLFFSRPFFSQGDCATSLFKTLSERDKTHHFLNLVGELDHLHRHGFFHGNLSLDNLALWKEKLVLLDPGVDFLCSASAKVLSSHPEEVTREAQSKDLSDFVSLLLRELPSLKDAVEDITPNLDVLRSILETLLIEPLGKEESLNRSSPDHSQKSRFLPRVIIVTVSVVAFLFGYFSFQDQTLWKILWNDGAHQELQGDWNSGEPARLQKVARKAAMESDVAAQTVILEAQEPDILSQFFHQPLRVALNAGWYDEFSEEEKASLFTFVLAPILRDEINSIPDLSSLHYGVALSLLAGLPASQSPEMLFRVLEAQKARLPVPYGLALDILSVESKEAAAKLFRAFARIATLGIDSQTLRIYIPSTLQETDVRLRVKLILLGLTEDERGALWEFLREIAGARQSVGWFITDSLAGWNSLPAQRLLEISYATKDFDGLTVQQLGDLLVAPFLEPDRTVMLIQEIASSANIPKLEEFLAVLSKDTTFSRDQVITLLSGLMLRGDARYAFLAKWFETTPAPESVLQLLIASKDMPQFDFFSLPASRYLKESTDWRITTEELDALSDHIDPLARGIAYSRASAANPAQRRLLERRQKLENNDALRKLIISKLSRTQ